MNRNEFYLAGAKAAKRVYSSNIDLGTTEYKLTIKPIMDIETQILAIAGTNEFDDWGKNLNLSSIDGIKKTAVEAAREIHDSVSIDPTMPLMVVGHSKAGATAIAYKKLYGAKYCMAFCPARSLKKDTYRNMKKTYVFIDPDDWVPKLGYLTFAHPIAQRITFEDNWGWHPGDHSIDHIIEELKAKRYTVTKNV